MLIILCQPLAEVVMCAQREVITGYLSFVVSVMNAFLPRHIYSVCVFFYKTTKTRAYSVVFSAHADFYHAHFWNRNETSLESSRLKTLRNSNVSHSTKFLSHLRFKYARTIGV